VKKVNGRPATGDSVSASISSWRLLQRSRAGLRNQQACMRATIKPIRQNKPSDPITIQFASVPASERPADCLMQEDISGRVFIDPAHNADPRMEFHAPNHVIGPESKTSKRRSDSIDCGNLGCHRRVCSGGAGWGELLAADEDLRDHDRQDRERTNGCTKLPTATTTSWR